MGDVRNAPVIVRRQLFCIVSSFLRCDGATFSKVIEPYSIIGRMIVV